MEEDLQTNADPYSQENIGVIQFIMLGRIYDTLMMLLTLENKDAADDLLSLHAQGKLMGPSPFFDGVFAFDELNKDIPPA